jgi:hypothetical protein
MHNALSACGRLASHTSMTMLQKTLIVYIMVQRTIHNVLAHKDAVIFKTADRS